MQIDFWGAALRCKTLIVSVRGMPYPKIGTTQYHTQLGLQDKGCKIKGLVVCTNWDKEPFNLENSLALGCYQPSPKIFHVVFFMFLYTFNKAFMILT